MLWRLLLFSFQFMHDMIEALQFYTVVKKIIGIFKCTRKIMCHLFWNGHFKFVILLYEMERFENIQKLVSVFYVDFWVTWNERFFLLFSYLHLHNNQHKSFSFVWIISSSYFSIASFILDLDFTSLVCPINEMLMTNNDNITVSL